MRQDFFDFNPTHKLLMAGNDKPSLHGVDEGTRRRFLLVPFTVQIPPHERNARLAEELQHEHAGILQWMIEGCLKWQATGLMVPNAVRDATDDYLAEEDVQSQWLDECIEVTHNRNNFELTQTLFASWQGWAVRRGLYAGTEKALSRELAAKFEKGAHPRTRQMGFRGINLKVQSGENLNLGLL
jgi:putative DNA primase/helicase